MTVEDIPRQHTRGFSDEQVWEAMFTVTTFSVLNRMADAFGLEPPASASALLDE